MNKKFFVFMAAGLTVLFLSVGMVIYTERRGADRAAVMQSIDLCRDYLIRAQTDDGNFIYEYDWVNQAISADDNQVRQAGALWSLSLYHAYSRNDDVAGSIRLGLDFFLRNSRLSPRGGRYVVYPGASGGRTGTVALVTLALIDFLRTETEPSDEKSRQYREALDEFVLFLRHAQNTSRLWHEKYTHETGIAYGNNSPYFDGEALLALTKYARYFNRTDLAGRILVSADAAYEAHVRKELNRKPGSPLLTGFYHWGTMAYYELVTSGWGDTERFTEPVFLMADWKVDRGGLRYRTGGASAYEGLAHAYGLAVLKGDTQRINRIGVILKEGLTGLLGLQVGGPAPDAEILGAGPAGSFEVGGVQYSPSVHKIRIDIVQHQMSAFIFAVQYYLNGK